MIPTNDTPVFKTVGQALYVALVMEVTPAAVKGSTQLMIEDLMRQRYGEEPVPASERSVNMAGLSPLEFRAQCARIRADVVQHLAKSECAAIHARFGHQATRGNGVHYLMDYLAPTCVTGNRDAILALIWGIYVPGVRQHPGESVTAFNQRRSKRVSEWSLRSIEKSYGSSKSTLGRDQQMLRERCHALEIRGQEEMERLFIASRLIVDPNTA